jgi:glycosyltransferase involved in cell wall biosynthesis
MVGTPSVSIVMPCYNVARHLPKSVGSVLGQSFGDWELIAVDDGSSDDTLAWLRTQTDPRIRVLHQPNRGVSAARNAGLEVASGDLVAFLDSDDWWTPEFLCEMTQALNAHPEAGLAYCGWQNIGLPGRRGAPFVPPNYEAQDKVRMLLEGNRWPIHAALTRRQLVLGAGGFDVRFQVGEDYLLWLQIACFHPIALVPKIMAIYQHHDGDRATRDDARAAIQTLEVQRAFLHARPEVSTLLGRHDAKQLTAGTLFKRGLEVFWAGHAETAQCIFRKALFAGGWHLRDLKYIAPALLPRSVYRLLVQAMRERR